MNKVFMETTKIDAKKTAGQIVSLLAASGARQIVMDHGSDKRLIGIRFTLEVAPNQLRAFALPVRTDALVALFEKKRSPRYRFSVRYDPDADREQAERVAWRQLFRWVEAQLAFIETGMVEAAEVFLPYLQDRSGNTLYALMTQGGMKMLTAGREEGV